MTQKASTGKSMEQEPNERYTDRNVGSSDRKNGSTDRKYGSTERKNGLAGGIVRTTVMSERQTGEQAYCTFYKTNPPPFLPRCNDREKTHARKRDNVQAATSQIISQRKHKKQAGADICRHPLVYQSVTKDQGFCKYQLL